MKRTACAAALALGLLAASASAQTTTGYLYYAGGGLAVPGNATAQDGTLTGDNGAFSVLVADVTISPSSVTVGNWRYAAGVTLGNPLPADNPNTTPDVEAYSWMFLENACHVHNGRLYVGPADWNGDGSRNTAPLVAHAPINGDGTLGAWTLSDLFPTPPADQAICATALVDFGSSAYYYVLGGTSSGTNRTLVAPILSGGNLGTWAASTDLPESDWFNRATAVGSTVVHASGNLATAIRQAHYATANSGNGQLSSWTSAGTYGAGAKQWDMAMASVRSAGGNDFAVISGGNAFDGKTFVTQVTGGVPGAWSETNALPTGVRRVAGTGAADVMFVMGGTVGTSAVTAGIDDVQVGRISDSGVITWATSDTDVNLAPMPQARSFGGTAFHVVTAPSSVGEWMQY